METILITFEGILSAIIAFSIYVLIAEKHEQFSLYTRSLLAVLAISLIAIFFARLGIMGFFVWDLIAKTSFLLLAVDGYKKEKKMINNRNEELNPIYTIISFYFTKFDNATSAICRTVKKFKKTVLGIKIKEKDC